MSQLLHGPVTEVEQHDAICIEEQSWQINTCKASGEGCNREYQPPQQHCWHLLFIASCRHLGFFCHCSGQAFSVCILLYVDLKVVCKRFIVSSFIAHRGCDHFELLSVTIDSAVTIFLHGIKGSKPNKPKHTQVSNHCCSTSNFPISMCSMCFYRTWLNALLL